MHETELSICTAPTPAVSSKLWPGSEDKALRGRNLSAVSRTLYRQVGETLIGLPSCAAKSWRVENQSDKSTVHINPNVRSCKATAQKTSPQNPNPLSNKTAAIGCPFFPGKYSPDWLKGFNQIQPNLTNFSQ